MTWRPETFLIAAYGGSIKVAGYTYRALGLHLGMRGSPKGRRPPRYVLTHLGTGHRVCIIIGKVEKVFPIATEIAECGDWDWEGFEGYKNRDPELLNRFQWLAAKHANSLDQRFSEPDEQAAREIAVARAGA